MSALPNPIVAKSIKPIFEIMVADDVAAIDLSRAANSNADNGSEHGSLDNMPGQNRSDAAKLESLLKNDLGKALEFLADKALAAHTIESLNHVQDLIYIAQDYVAEHHKHDLSLRAELESMSSQISWEQDRLIGPDPIKLELHAA